MRFRVLTILLALPMLLSTASIGETAQQAQAQQKKKQKAPKKRPPFRWVNPLPKGKYPGVQHHTFKSPSMKIDVGYCIYLPPGYAKTTNGKRRYPVVYYLHGGRPGGETKSVSLSTYIHAAMTKKQIAPAIYVFVNGGEVSHYNYSEKKSMGEDVFIKELIPHVDKTYRTVADRAGRGLEGFSQGGRGTARIMFKHPHLFSSAAPGGGGHATEKRISEEGGRESETLKFAKGYNTYDLARKYAANPKPPLKILVFVGNKGFNYENNLEYMKFLDSLKIPYQRIIIENAPHSARIIYDKRGLEIMKFHSENFRKALEHSPTDSGTSRKKRKKRKTAALPAGVKVLKDIEYAKIDDISLKLDIYQPAKSETKPALIVWIHGGAWSKGSKNRCPIAWITAHGYAIASVDYRLSGTAKFPALVHDCKGAIRWLRANAEKYGYAAERIGVAGSSSGGHLAALVGTSGDVIALEGNVGGHLDQSSRVHAIVDMYGPTDLFHNATVEKERCDKPDCPLFQLLGGKPSERTDAARLASPVHNVTADDPPIIILHGTEDKSLVKAFQGRFLHDKYRKTGLKSTFQVIEGAGHGGPQYSDPERRKLILGLFDANVKRKTAS